MGILKTTVIALAGLLGIAGCQGQGNKPFTSVTSPAKAKNFASEFRYPLDGKYHSGSELCELNKQLTTAEVSFRVRSPVNPRHPEEGEFFLYAWHANDYFDPSLPTAILLQGGPGSDLHGMPAILNNWNLVYLDQRGVGCSRPEREQDFRNENFLSSENTASDIPRILEHLGVDQASIYAVSYGTVPATIAASRYSTQVRAVILEAVPNPKFDSTLPDAKPLRLQRVYDSLSKVQKIWLDTHFTKADENHLFPELVAESSLYNFPRQKLNFLLSKLIKDPSDQSVLSLINGFGPNRPQTQESAISISAENWTKALGLGLNSPQRHRSNTSEYSYGVEPYVNQHILCKEYVDLGKSRRMILKNGKVVRTEEKNNSCSNAGVERPLQFAFSYSQWKVDIPMTYIHGAGDEITPLPGLDDHWNLVPRSSAQRLIAREGGHNSLIRLLIEAYPVDFNNSPTQQPLADVITTALNGKSLQTSQLLSLESSTGMGWRYRSKLGDQITSEWKPDEFQIRSKKTDLNLHSPKVPGTESE